MASLSVPCFPRSPLTHPPAHLPPPAELAYAINRVGVTTLVLAPELRGTSLVDLLESIRQGLGLRRRGEGLGARL